MKTTRKTALITALVCFAQFASAQHGQFINSSFLSSGNITSIIQDRTGYIWIGTEYGLNKYDGYRFQQYHYNSEDSLSICSNIVTSLSTDSCGNLWVGTSNGLCRYDYETDKFRHLHFNTETQPRITSIQASADSSVMCSTAGFGLFSIKEDSITTITQYNTEKEQISFCTYIVTDKQGRFWHCDNKGRATCHGRFGAKIKEVASYESKLGSILGMVPIDLQHTLIICQHGIVRYDGMSFTEILKENEIKFELSRVLDTGNGELLLGTIGNGAWKFDISSHKLTPVETGIREIDFPTTIIRTAFRDKENNIWLGCQGRGLVFIPGKEQPFRTWDFANHGILTSCQITSIAPYSTNSLLVTLKNNGLHHLTGRTLTSSTNTPSDIDYVYVDTDKRFWITANGMLYSYDPQTKAAKPAHSYPMSRVASMCDDGHGRIFISTFSKGVMIYDTNTGKAEQLSMLDRRGIKDPKIDTLDVLCNDWVQQLTCDSRGLVWCASADGICCYSPEARTFRYFGWTKLLDYNICNTICENKDGNMLIGTNSGLYYYDADKDSIGLAPQSDALKNLSISSIVCDRGGEIWISTSQGIWHQDPRTQQYVRYDHIKGFGGHEYTLGVGGLTPNGAVFFGQSDGFVYFNPTTASYYTPIMHKMDISGVLINGKLGSAQNTNSPVCIKQKADHTEVEIDNASVELCFSSFQYDETSAIKLQYRFDDDPWQTNTPGDNVISLRNLKPGKYTLTVHGSLFGVDSPDSTYKIRIKGNWLWSLWFNTLLTLVVIAILVYFYRRSRHKLRYVMIGTDGQQLVDADKLNTESHDNTPASTEMLPMSKPSSPSDNHILIVDDDEQLTEYLSKELAAYYSITTCSNGNEALKLLLKSGTEFDLVVSDEAMPEMDGMTLLRNIKSNVRLIHIPVIMLIAKTGIEGRIKGLKLGADALLYKPFVLEELLVTIDAQLANLRRRKSKFSGIFEPNNPDLEAEAHKSAKTDSKLMERIIQLCNQNMSNTEFDVDQLCSEVGISRSQLHRKMKEMTGIGSGEFIRNLRLEQAARLLREGQLNVSEVAYAVGFVNLGHFSKIFRQHFGVSPSQYHDHVEG